MEELKSKFVVNHSKATQCFLDIFYIGQKFMRSEIYKMVSFFVLWKLLTEIPKTGFWAQIDGKNVHSSDLIKDIETLCVEYIRENIDENGDIEKYKRFKNNLNRFAKYIRFVDLLL